MGRVIEKCTKWVATTKQEIVDNLLSTVQPSVQVSDMASIAPADQTSFIEVFLNKETIAPDTSEVSYCFEKADMIADLDELDDSLDAKDIVDVYFEDPDDPANNNVIIELAKVEVQEYV